jgi:hypothetical protein
MNTLSVALVAQTATKMAKLAGDSPEFYIQRAIDFLNKVQQAIPQQPVNDMTRLVQHIRCG